MSAKVWIWIFLVVTLPARCRQAAPVEVTRSTGLEDLASGSALIRRGDSVLIAGDDAPFLLLGIPSGSSWRRVAIGGSDTTISRIAKAVKPDWEAGALLRINGEEQTWIFGSGSLSPHRDSLLVLSPDGRQQKIDAKPLYDSLRTRIGTATLNIEGAAAGADALYLLNRSTNTIFRIPLSQLLPFVRSQGRTAISGIEWRRISLPTHRGTEATLSGACRLPDGGLLFSASLEAGATALADGEVLGSYLGVWHWPETKPRLVLPLANGKGALLPEKVESLESLGRAGDGRLRVLALVDNDDGHTKLLEVLLPLDR